MMNKVAADRMMGALKSGKKPKKMPIDAEDMAEMAKVGKKKFIKNEQSEIKSAKRMK